MGVSRVCVIRAFGEAQGVADAPIGVGSAFELVARFAGRNVSVRDTIVSYDPPRRVELKAARPGFASREALIVELAQAGSRVHFDASLSIERAWRVVRSDRAGARRRRSGSRSPSRSRPTRARCASPQRSVRHAVVHQVADQRAARPALERVDVLPDSERAAQLPVDETAARLQRSMLSASARASGGAKPVVDQGALAHRDRSRGKEAEVPRGRCDRLEVEGVGGRRTPGRPGAGQAAPARCSAADQARRAISFSMPAKIQECTGKRPYQ